MTTSKTHKRLGFFAHLLILALVGLLTLTLTPPAYADTKTRSSSFEYNPANGLLTKEVIEPDAPSSCLQTSYSYDSSGNKASASASACAGASAPATNSASAARTSTSSYAYTAAQTVVTSANALGHQETRTIERKFGQTLSLLGPNSLTTTWSYDTFGRKTRETRADNTKTTWDYQYCTSAGMTGLNVVACPAMVKASHVAYYVVTQRELGVNDAEISPAKLLYTDALGRTLRSQTKDFAGNTIVQDTEYNDLGQVERTSQIYVLGASPIYITYTYDDLGRVLTASSPDSTAPGGVATTSNSYNGLTTSTTNAKGQTKTTTKNSQGQTASVVDNQGGVTSYAYDALGQLVQTNAAGSITTLGYNQRGQKVSMIDPAMGVWSYSYNVFGELVSQTDSLQQTSTMAYDRLGRMTARVEPDLTSNWYYDTKADGSACGKSAGKLCQATAANGYSRVHNYDSLGRGNTTSTVLDSASSPATVSVGFDATTGRLATKTWPTGYAASYTYNSMGYLMSMVGGGGSFQSARIDVLNYDSQGRITSYKHGNNVVTNKTYTADTGRLTAIQATLNGSGCANCVQSMGYVYDSLGNLASRNDSMIGVNDLFTYDGLNRLKTTLSSGGGISGNQETEVLYDARGNIKYKSDVGQYWYDSTRPNRITGIFLTTPSEATKPVTGTRTLAFAFDDYKPTATNVGGTTMGNGNLMYTVSQDTSIGKHTVRWESYTSFNMPLQIEYANLSNASAGATGGTTTIAATTQYGCPNSSWQLAGTNCTSTASTAAVLSDYSCPAGQVRSGSTCLVPTVVGTATVAKVCPRPTAPGSQLYVEFYGLNAAQTSCYFDALVYVTVPDGEGGTYGYMSINATQATAINGAGYTCVDTAGYGRSGCSRAPLLVYSCPASQVVSGTSCASNVPVAATPLYTCAAGQTKVGAGASTTCQGPVTQPAVASYSCPSGYSLSGNQCRAVTSNAASGASGTSSDRTLSFIYGPEHQRIKQITTLTNNAPSQYQAGTVWYLNGEDGQSLTYEKEIKASGITEHKHYLQAAGMTFALYTQRTGAGVTTDGTAAQAASTSYTCPAGQTVSGTSCIVPILVPPTQSTYSCTNGAAPVGSTCPVQNITTAAPSPGTSCPLPAITSGLWVQSVYNSASQCNFSTLVSMTWVGEDGGSGTYWGYDAAKATAQNGLGYSCTVQGDETNFYLGCTRAPVVAYNCPATYTASGTGAATVCSKSTTSYIAAAPVFACQAGQTATGSGSSLACQTSVTTAALASYSCPAGYGPQGNQCVASSKLSTAAQSTRYFQQDHLGSIAVITDEAGVVVERLSYDAWGKRRNANGLPDPADSLVGLTTDRGYTEHEHLDEVGVIHMNGRVYDPLVGRFMSADPFIQAPFELQSHNRYAYVMNNPLAYTDPSGYFALLDEVANLGSSIANVSHQIFGNPIVQSIATIVAAAEGCTQCVIAIQAASAYDRTGGSVTAAVKAGLITWGTTLAFGAAGDVGAKFGIHGVAHYAAHGLVGCVSSVANGGRCEAGALSSIATLGWQQAGMRFGSREANVAANAVVGGVTTVLGGGKFANGAITGAFSYLYNECQHTKNCGSKGGYDNGDKVASMPISDAPLEAVYPEKLIPVARGVSMVARFVDWLTTSNSPSINFQTGHYDRRLVADGLSVSAVESVVRSEVSAMSNSLSVGATASGRTAVGATMVEYRLMVKSDGSISVGTIFKVK